MKLEDNANFKERKNLQKIIQYCATKKAFFSSPLVCYMLRCPATIILSCSKIVFVIGKRQQDSIL